MRRGCTRLYLIRHGETDYNLRGIMQGTTDVPLNATGEAQARAVAEVGQRDAFRAAPLDEHRLEAGLEGAVGRRGAHWRTDECAARGAPRLTSW